jgi:mercuric ion binding protein
MINLKTTVILFMMAISLSTLAQKKPVETAEGHKVVIKTSAICEMCKEAIEYDLAFEKGVKMAELNLETKEVTVVYNDKKTSDEIIRKRITMVGYHADTLKRDPEAYNKLPFCCKDGGH